MKKVFSVITHGAMLTGIALTGGHVLGKNQMHSRPTRARVKKRIRNGGSMGEMRLPHRLG